MFCGVVDLNKGNKWIVIAIFIPPICTSISKILKKMPHSNIICNKARMITSIGKLFLHYTYPEGSKLCLYRYWIFPKVANFFATIFSISLVFAPHLSSSLLVVGGVVVEQSTNLVSLSWRSFLIVYTVFEDQSVLYSTVHFICACRAIAYIEPPRTGPYQVHWEWNPSCHSYFVSVSNKKKSTILINNILQTIVRIQDKILIVLSTSFLLCQFIVKLYKIAFGYNFIRILHTEWRRKHIIILLFYKNLKESQIITLYATCSQISIYMITKS